MDKIRILFLSANPVDTSSLKLDEEVREIESKIRAAEHRDSLELVTKWAVRPDDLLQSLNQHKPHVVHFSGHGTPTEEIILLDKLGQPKPVSTESLLSLFRTLKDNIRVVLLNACYSLPQAEAITQVIDCAIGMKRQIGDDAAITFAASFYRAIGFGRSVKEAFDQGRTAVMLEGIREQNTPDLLTRQAIEAKDIILVVGQRKTVSASHVELLEALLDPKDSPYCQSQAGDVVVINYVAESKSRKYSFPTIDFKLRNTGNAAAFLRRFQIEVLSAKIDPTPVLEFRACAEGATFAITVVNHGWGPAIDLELEFLEPTLNRLFGAQLRQRLPVVEQEHVISWSLNDASPDELRAIQSTYQKLVNSKWFRYELPDRARKLKPTWMKDSQTDSPEVAGVEIGDIQVSWSASDENGRRYSGESKSWLGHTALTRDGFLRAKFTDDLRAPCAWESDRTYVTYVGLDPDLKSRVLDYPISRKVPAGDIDRFHVMIGAAKSCRLRVRFAMVLDKDTVIRSDEFEFQLWNPRNERIETRYADGAELRRREEEIHGILRSGNYPGDHDRLRRELVTLAQAKSEYPSMGPFGSSRDE